MSEVRICSRGDSLVLSPEGFADSILVTLVSSRLRAETRPRDRYDLQGLASYFADLAETAMAGWEGAKTWESIERDIRLESTLRKGRLTIRAALREERVAPANGGWSAELDITVDLIEELRHYASQARNLLEPA